MPRAKAGLPGVYNLAALTLPDGSGAALALDSAGRLIVSPSSGGSATPSTVGDGSKNVTTAGTRVTLASTTACKSVVVMAKLTNTGKIYVGGATVSSTSGIELAAGETISLDVSDLASVQIDSSVNGEGVKFTYVA